MDIHDPRQLHQRNPENWTNKSINKLINWTYKSIFTIKYWTHTSIKSKLKEMTRAQRKLRIEQLDKKLNAFSSLKTPKEGWIKTIRTALNISPNTLAKRLNISASGLYKLEEREENGAVTIKSLEQTAQAMDMQLVYGLIPNAGSLEKMIEEKARKMAIEIIRKTSINMELEDQANNQERLKIAVEDKTRELIEKQPSELWD